jgi:hypothetical protein
MHTACTEGTQRPVLTSNAHVDRKWKRASTTTRNFPQREETETIYSMDTQKDSEVSSLGCPGSWGAGGWTMRGRWVRGWANDMAWHDVRWSG